MTVSRVTTSMMADVAARNLSVASNELARLQNQAATLKKITRPSDDPAGTLAAMGLRADKAAVDQYIRNSQDGQGWLSSADSALSNSVGILTSARDLTIQGANQGALTPAAREGIAKQLDALSDALLSEANTKYLGRNVFSGNSDAAASFDRTTYNFNASAGNVTRRIDNGTTIPVDTDGQAAFGSGATSVFAELKAIAADLRAGVNVSGRIASLDSHLNNMLAAQSSVGARQATLMRMEDIHSQTQITLESQRADIEDVDAAQAYTDLQHQQLSYQAALMVTAKSMSPTLMDFLR